MRCSEFLEHFSDFVDEAGSPGLLDELRAHLESCGSCQRYHDTWSFGRDLLLGSTLDETALSVDFHERLQHRIYSVDDRRALARYGSLRGTAAGVAVIATLLVVGLLLPGLTAEPEVTLARIVVDRPEPRPIRVQLPLPSFLPRQWAPSHLESTGDDLWDRPWVLFQEYAPVRVRGRSASVTQTLLD